MQVDTLILVALCIQAVVLFVCLFMLYRNRNGAYRYLVKDPLYRELHYIKALIVIATAMIVFLGWNIQTNVIDDISEELRNKIEQDFSAALTGYVAEVKIDSTQKDITYQFSDLRDIQGCPINNGRKFKKRPFVNLNYTGQPYTVTKVTNAGFTVSKLCILKGASWDEQEERTFDDNSLFLWIISRDDFD